MIGTRLVEELVQSVALSHLVAHRPRVSLLMLAPPESGKTTIAKSATCAHVCRVAVITGRSIVREAHDHPETEFLLFNDLTAVRAMSLSAVNLLINILNQFTQGETGKIAFAGKDVEEITRPLGIIGCMPFSTFTDHRSRWREMGFISRMIPFAYEYPHELVAEIKDLIDEREHGDDTSTRPHRPMPKAKRRRPVSVAMPAPLARDVRRIADAKAIELKQLGIRLLANYHTLVRAHAILLRRATVAPEDITFLRAVDAYVSISKCTPLHERRAAF